MKAIGVTLVFLLAVAVMTSFACAMGSGACLVTSSWTGAAW
jgi:hypothetical protein